jgi:hypothetical protein
VVIVGHQRQEDRQCKCLELLRLLEGSHLGLEQVEEQVVLGQPGGPLVNLERAEREEQGLEVEPNNLVLPGWLDVALEDSWVRMASVLECMVKDFRHHDELEA